VGRTAAPDRMAILHTFAVTGPCRTAGHGAGSRRGQGGFAELSSPSEWILARQTHAAIVSTSLPTRACRASSRSWLVYEADCRARGDAAAAGMLEHASHATESLPLGDLAARKIA